MQTSLQAVLPEVENLVKTFLETHPGIGGYVGIRDAEPIERKKWKEWILLQMWYKHTDTADERPLYDSTGPGPRIAALRTSELAVVSTFVAQIIEAFPGMQTDFTYRRGLMLYHMYYPT